MAVITKIEVQKNNSDRANIYVDDEFYAGVNIELIIKYGLKKGVEIDEHTFQGVLLDDLKKGAFNKAIKYIGNAIKSTKQLKEYLRKKEYSNDVIECVIDKLCEYKYLDDSAFAKSFVLTYSSKYGKLKLIAMLKSKGISDSIIDDIFCENNINNNIENTARKYIKNKNISQELWLKLSRFLYSRGYEYDDISKIIEVLKDEIC